MSSCTLTLQLIFSQCIMLVPDFFYALWHLMQDEMCHKVWLFVTSAKNVTLPKSLYVVRQKLRSTVYLMVSTSMGERLLLKKELREVCLTDFVWTAWRWALNLRNCCCKSSADMPQALGYEGHKVHKASAHLEISVSSLQQLAWTIVGKFGN